jgi:hypothetical protein
MGKRRGLEKLDVSRDRACPSCSSPDLECEGISHASTGSWEDPGIIFWRMKCRACAHVFEYREIKER